MQFYNTLTKQLDDFKPIDPTNIRMYVCGPTVYDFAHVGNARPVVVFDVLYRLLQHFYGLDSVVYVRNITDIDDKIIAKANELNVDISEVTEKSTLQFHSDMRQLFALDPTFEPKATDHVADMIAMITKLVQNNYAYICDGHVVFDTTKIHKILYDGELLAGARVESASYKRNPADFVLWKPSINQPGWDSPWSYGRPGWHIECSAMAKRYLGDVFDIHGGGQDLIFPHHENEIAQSCSANHTDILANMWLHNGYVTVNGKKMAKSDGNFITVHQLLDEGIPGEAIRLTLLSAHYRQPLDINHKKLNVAKAQLDKLYLALRKVKDIKIQDVEPDVTDLGRDLNTPEALSKLHKIANTINKETDTKELSKLKSLLLKQGNILGLLNHDPENWFKSNKHVKEIEVLIAKRNRLRRNKNFEEADQIREELKKLGVILEDNSIETAWRIE